MSGALATSPQTEPTRFEQLGSMTLLEHLEELRKRIVWSIMAVGGTFFLCFYYSNRIFAYVQQPIIQALRANKMEETLVYTNPIEPFNLYVETALIAAIFIASPFVLYQIWMFIAPGLYKHERRYVVPFMCSTVGLFLAGGFFGYKIVYPRALEFLISFGGQFKPMITVSEYMDLFLKIILGLGLVFELPILIFFLALMGLVSAGFLWRNLRYAIMVIFIVAAIVTPTPDVVNMCIFAAPMIALYVLGIGIAWLVHPSRRKKAAEGS
jgi:sec-independent protein translocase protein TatC